MAAETLRFRPAMRDDADSIRDLVRSAYAKWVPLIGREPMPMQADYAMAVAEHDFDLLLDGDTLVGLLETMHRPDHLWIENIAVHPDRQHQGLGRKLLKWAERRAEVAGTSELRLLTNAAFESNVSLYKKAGFKIDRTEPFKGGTTVYMSRNI
ncbi:MAG: GNAT family N-acetyltransferase [Devosia sp.]